MVMQNSTLYVIAWSNLLIVCQTLSDLPEM
jgi:hypothetical protein